MLLTQWSRTLTVASQAALELTPPQREQLVRRGIQIEESAVVGLVHQEGMLRELALADGRRLPADRLFFTARAKERTALATQLGCELNELEGIAADHRRETQHGGIYAAGDILRDDVQFLILAAGQGTAAAVRINRSLLADELETTGSPLVKR